MKLLEANTGTAASDKGSIVMNSKLDTSAAAAATSPPPPPPPSSASPSATSFTSSSSSSSSSATSAVSPAASSIINLKNTTNTTNSNNNNNNTSNTKNNPISMEGGPVANGSSSSSNTEMHGSSAFTTSGKNKLNASAGAASPLSNSTGTSKHSSSTSNKIYSNGSAFDGRAEGNGYESTNKIIPEGERTQSKAAAARSFTNGNSSCSIHANNIMTNSNISDTDSTAEEESTQSNKTTIGLANGNNNSSSSSVINGNNSTRSEATTNGYCNAASSMRELVSPDNVLLSADLTATSEHENLEFGLVKHPCSVLAGMDSLRRQRQFCDISLLVEDQEFPAHRAVLAACSPHLLDFLACLEDTSEQLPIYKLGRDVPAAGFGPLLDFMYTGRLSVPLENVPTVYATALDLKMESATRACADFLSTHLTAANCLGIRRLTKDKTFKETVDAYICSNLENIINSKAFFGLTEMQVEVVGLDEEISDQAMERRMFSLVLDWAKNNLNDLKPKMDRLLEQVNVLYLDSGNTLRDCAQVEDTVLSSDDEVVQDYKIMARRRSHGGKKDGGKHSVPLKAHGAQPFQKFSLNPEDALSVAEREWSIIAIHRNSDNAYLAIAMLDGHLMAISVHVRPQVLSSNNGSSNGGFPDSATNGFYSCNFNGHRRSGSNISSTSSGKPDSPTGTSFPIGRNGGGVSPTTILRKTSIIPLASMSTARCAMGAAELDGKLVVCGGYDRGECLQGVESFCIHTNTWTSKPSMNRARGRFSCAVLDGCIYVCGGSDGWHELACVERFDPGTDTWSFMASMIKQRSSHGVATLNGKLYCVGGCEGQRSMADCEVYDPETNKWTKIAPLNSARSQACLVAVEGSLLAIGGTDMWNTLSSVEMYNPETNEWVISCNLNIARRGAGVDIVDGQVVVAGGSDGSHSLTSSEILDPVSNTWTVGPALIVPRANLSVVAMGTRLYALGGFSGKKFLSSLEWLDLEDMEWFGHTPRDATAGLGRPSSEEQEADVKVSAAGASGGNTEKFATGGNGSEKGARSESGKKVEHYGENSAVA